RRWGDDSGVVAALDGDSGEGGCHGVGVVTRWRWVDVEPCRGGAGGGEAAEWSRWRVGERGVGDRAMRTGMYRDLRLPTSGPK
nr:hypothetical protein [Tanacetum cinerariifolium]